MLHAFVFAGLTLAASSAFAGLEECHHLVIDPHAPPHALSDCLKAHAHDAPSARSQLYRDSQAKLYSCVDAGGCAAREVGDAINGMADNAPPR